MWVSVGMLWVLAELLVVDLNIKGQPCQWMCAKEMSWVIAQCENILFHFFLRLKLSRRAFWILNNCMAEYIIENKCNTVCLLNHLQIFGVIKDKFYFGKFYNSLVDWKKSLVIVNGRKLKTTTNWAAVKMLLSI